jgi:uncharacterized membrane protein
VLIAVGGYGMAYHAGLDLGSPWLLIGQGLFGLSGVIWLSILVPAQLRLHRMARDLPDDALLHHAYRRQCRQWLIWGIVATALLVMALFLMIAKP